jgi:hypothetical protein
MRQHNKDQSLDMVVICSENHWESTNKYTVWENVELLNVKASGTFSHNCFGRLIYTNNELYRPIRLAVDTFIFFSFSVQKMVMR